MNDDVVSYEKLINKLTKELNYLKSKRHTWEQRLSNIELEYCKLRKDYQELKDSLVVHSVGLQNVYDKFQEIISGSLIQHNKSKLEKMTYDLDDIKRDLKKDIDFVKKAYKIMPSMVKIKELDDESYERFMKVIELIG